jgi:dienelactone hydrolase
MTFCKRLYLIQKQTEIEILQNAYLRLLKYLVLICLLLPLTTSCHKSISPLTAEATRPKPADTLDKSEKSANHIPQRVSFYSMDHDKPTLIQALYFRPENTGSRQLPAVIAMHGCGGMYSSAKSKKESLSVRHQLMADLLVAEGYAVLFPDSFRSRGAEEICTIENRKRTITQKQRRLDAQGALAWLQSRSDIFPDKIAILGWSHGASAVLATLNARQPVVAAWSKQVPPAPYFRAGVAFYPGCRESLNSTAGYSLAAPLTFFIGGSDDWTAPEPCIELAENLKVAGENASITVYPDAHHGFDGPSSQPRKRLEVPNGVNPGRGVTTASNPAARTDAYARLKIFLRKHLVQ